MNDALIQKVCRGKPDAMAFLALFIPYSTEVDDIIDGDRTVKREQLMTFARAPLVFSDPFYLNHLLELRQLVINVTIAYADSVDWENSDVAWQRQWADHYRHCGLEIPIAVACICGGPEHAASISKELRTLCHNIQHPEDAQ